MPHLRYCHQGCNDLRCNFPGVQPATTGPTRGIAMLIQLGKRSLEPSLKGSMLDALNHDFPRNQDLKKNIEICRPQKRNQDRSVSKSSYQCLKLESF